MKKGDKKKRDKALKRRAQSKMARGQQRAIGMIHPALRLLKQARTYSFENCWVQDDWQENGLAVVCVARRQPNGNILFGVYLVDYYCLGVKDAYFNADIPPATFQREFLPKIFRAAGKPISISADLAHEIIYGAAEYARQFGFRPHADFDRAQMVLDPPEMHPRTGAVTFGKDGKPFYISGPHDNVNAIMRQLARAAGEDNYNYLAHIDDPSKIWIEDEEDEGEGEGEGEGEEDDF